VTVNVTKISKFKYRISVGQKTFFVIRLDRRNQLEGATGVVKLKQEVADNLELNFMATGTYIIDVFVINDNFEIKYMTTENIAISSKDYLAVDDISRAIKTVVVSNTTPGGDGTTRMTDAQIIDAIANVNVS
jgi:hypothetical protein